MALTNSYFKPDQRTPGFVGHPFPDVEARLMDLETKEIHERQDEEGELLIQSPCLFDRYLDNPEATEKTFTTDKTGQKWFLTGDCAKKSSKDNGSFQILGRLSQDIIKKQGYKISALEIESSLLKSPLVKSCAVVGVPHEEYGEEIVAFIVLKDASDTKAQHWQIVDFMKEQVSSYKRPRIFEFVESLPVNAMGKVSKKDLKS